MEMHENHEYCSFELLNSAPPRSEETYVSGQQAIDFHFPRSRVPEVKRSGSTPHILCTSCFLPQRGEMRIREQSLQVSTAKMEQFNLQAKECEPSQAASVMNEHERHH